MEQYSRVYAKIDLDAIEHNMEAMHRLIKPDTKILAVVKADGYGHGAVDVAHIVESLDYLYGFAVATAEEAFILRRNGIKKPILVLGYVFPEHYAMLAEWDIRPTVYTLEMAQQLSKAAKMAGRDLPVHIKIDTGMGRIGMQATKENAKMVAHIASLGHIIVEGIFTHFAKADEAEKEYTLAQLELFQTMIAWIEQEGVTIPYHHCSNSAALLDLPQANMDLVRAGISLYGLWPSKEVQRSQIKLQPALELKSHVIYVKEMEAGRSISYGGTYTTTEREKIATIPVGYGDGYPRSLSNRGYVLIHGQKAPIRGRICMDQFMVDVTHIPDVSVGDTVTLIGVDGGLRLTIEELGDLSGRFHYEFACCLGKRIPRIFYRNGYRITERDCFFE